MRAPRRLWWIAGALFAAHACAANFFAPAGERRAAPAAAASSCALPAESGAHTYALRYDEVGYLPEGERWAVLLSAGHGAPHYRVFELATGCVVGSEQAGPRVLDTMSFAGQKLTADRVALDMIARPGRYVVALEDGSQFGPIVVDATAYDDLVPKLVGFLRTQRCGPVTHAVSQHDACHLFASTSAAHSGDAVAVEDGFRGNVGTQTGPAVNLEGGWHDAGDYVKFVGTTSFVVAVDLLALRDHPGAFASVRADLRAEMRWGLEWLLKMLSGPELYYQVSGEKDHDAPWRSPEADTTTPVRGYEQRPAFRFGTGKGANLLGRAAAAFALGAQVFADDAPFASRLLDAAKAVYAKGRLRPKPQETTPASIYPEDSALDDLAFGAAVLARATGDAAFRDDALARARVLALAPTGGGPRPLYWGDVSALALLETARAFPAGLERTEMGRALGALASPFLATSHDAAAPASAFHYAMPSLDNGSIAQSLGAASVCLAWRAVGGSAECVELARSQLHWLFGQNPFGLSFFVGAGNRSPEHIHHALFQAAKIPVTGAILGGPTALATLASDKDLPKPSTKGPYAGWSTSAVLYEDTRDNYVVNEPAIDFTAPLVFVLAELLDPH
jgi:hypothetical protein